MSQDDSKIERLKRTLYSRNEKIVPKDERSQFHGSEINVRTSWGEEPNYDIAPEVVVQRNNSFFNRFLLGAVIFFVISVGVASFIFFGGINMISSNNLIIDVVAPTSVSSGEELSINLSIKNGNRANLEGATLFIDYPEGTESALEEGRKITYDKINLGIVEKGGSSEQNIRAILFGEKDSIKSFNFRIEYRVKGSNAVFSKERVYEVVIGSSPILLEVKYPSEINSGQDVTFSIDLTSNSAVPIQNVLMKIDYPYGFTYKNSSISPVRDNSVWNIGDLKDGDRKNIKVTGTLIGQNLEDRSFRISVGSKSGSVYDFDTSLASSLITLGLRKSFFDLEVLLSGNNYIKSGSSGGVNISWQNTLPDKIFDSKIEAKLSGTALDRSEVDVKNGGYYRSIDNTILWDKNSNDFLIEMLPGERSSISVSVGVLDNLIQPKIIKNPFIKIDVNISGERAGRESGTISSESSLIIKVPTTFTLSSKSLRSLGPFSNIGPIPPSPDKESTYTINWAITNTTNDVKEVSVRASLPQGVSWKGEVSPQSEKITFDQNTRMVIWDVGNISAGSGFTTSSRQVFFKVGFIPSISDIGSSPILVLLPTATAIDTYVEIPLTSRLDGTSTNFSDPSFKFGDGGVK